MKTEKAANYVKTRNKTLPEYQFGNFHVFVQAPISEDIDISEVFKDINMLLPEHFLNLVDIVYIGEFNFLKEREINAMYSDGALYISNIQDDAADLKDDLVHEISHAVEERYGQMLYSDEKIKNEFLLKRSKLKRILSFQDYDISGLDFLQTEYDKDFDNFLYKDVGYDALQMLTVDLFINPYAATSLKEYFATGFEEYYLENKLYLNKLSPYVYKKLSLLNLNNVEELKYEY
jgi:hypothetical protein|tara:strand:+ start:680 stop:1378 length:699 start_codon:yes stop_codon:yes gene_type:complete